MDKPLSLEALETNLREANAALENAERETSMARACESVARNRVNDCQKKLDAAIADLKKAAPRDTNWARSKGFP